MTALRILTAGPGVTLQDGGRHGYLRFGVTAAGPMDRLAFATANAAAGAKRNATAIEVSLGGLELAADAAVSLAVAGGAFRIELAGRPLPSAAVATLEPGQKLAIRPGISGRALAAGDVLPFAEPRTIEPKLATLDAHWLARAGTTIRVVLGPQDDYFTKAAIAAFLAGPWTLSARSDRMAYLLEGERLAHAKGFNIVSDGIAFGAIQVPGDGQPVVLMADRQPTGGYPKIANVIGADLGKIAQLRPGTQISFAAVTIEEAVAARRAEALALERPIPREPLMRTEFPSEFLLGLNLVDGVIADDAADEGA